VNQVRGDLFIWWQGQHPSTSDASLNTWTLMGRHGPAGAPFPISAPIEGRIDFLSAAVAGNEVVWNDHGRILEKTFTAMASN
jgi:hypothetical protein